ncbi:MAG: penicillin-binding protein 2 [Candidatus Cloacimonadales bacterium]|nr:penicillin-binding protein 2 [Candidatus Cloacimonadota bacterium]MDD2650890.1 penicillin-binding protein 2 [Candidatus Cloacimonadota bacterium]MDD3500873.1 penicillin-binding protein 2 [Candidatus Cloacimonadota bacterium]MDX9977168.1 penicillin-binding protein 2 [Candidatus Cloacimonadales bacterium]
MNQKSKTVLLYRIILGAIFVVLAYALFSLQIVKGSQYKEIAERNYVRIKSLEAARGVIYDEKLNPIAVNNPSINLYYKPFLIKDKEKMADFVSAYLPISKETILKSIYDNRYSTFNEVILCENIDYAVMAAISENLNYYPELFFKVETIRSYIINNHFTGYVGRINEKEYNTYKDDGYKINSLIGKSGIERYYERILRGNAGYEIIQVDAYGRNLKIFKDNLSKKPENGLHIVLNINLDLQKYVNSLFPEKTAGAIVVINPKTGGVLAYSSFPEYDQNLFTAPISNEQWSCLIDDPQKPMLDRVINGSYPPGSTFKTVTGSFGLEKEYVNPQTLLASCIGGLQIGNRFFKCWTSYGHGRLSFIDAIKVSCDVYFYDLSKNFKLNEFAEFVRKNHLIERTGIDLPYEKKGFFPNNEWYTKRLGKNFGSQGLKANLAIGQGEVLTTPIQLCAYYAAIANDGIWKKPHLLKKAIGDRTLLYEELEENINKTLPISEKNLKLIQEGLWQAVNGKNSTGGGARVNGVKVYGKTGSAENAHGDDTHAWFACYATWDEPELAIVVFLENAGHGGSMAAPIAGKIISYYNKNVREQ